MLRGEFTVPFRLVEMLRGGIHGRCPAEVAVEARLYGRRSIRNELSRMLRGLTLLSVRSFYVLRQTHVVRCRGGGCMTAKDDHERRVRPQRCESHTNSRELYSRSVTQATRVPSRVGSRMRRRAMGRQADRSVAPLTASSFERPWRWRDTPQHGSLLGRRSGPSRERAVHPLGRPWLAPLAAAVSWHAHCRGWFRPNPIERCVVRRT